eukprot:TRINITY_DN991_c0_g1_i3.p1 TRINITY_DN991_c0_g1~~TRINITY_DN991_c0_g1_i3.p1  ORF type:complete len:140 (+),score=30.24 TRINITY_DN991_c0_g1_i3:126-545(+)
MAIVMLDFKKSINPMLILVFLVSICSSILRPDYNTMVALILMIVVRQGLPENFTWINLILVFTTIVDIVWLTLEGRAHWSWAPATHHFSYLFSIINVIAKCFLVMFCVITVRNWNEETTAYFCEEPLSIAPVSQLEQNS